MGAIPQKAWDPGLEKGILESWKGLYGFDHTKKAYTIDTPPPYPSGRPWHIGAAAHYSQIDMIARTARMRGRNVYFPIGIDRNGLPVELYTEKKHKIRMRDTERSEFLKLCRGSLDELESEMVRIMKSLGMSCDLDNRYRTDSDEYRALTQATFIQLWNEGLVYAADRPNNYDWKSGTVIADAEITYEDRPSKLVYMRFGTKDGHVIIASTRPELLCACRAIIVNPEDERYRGVEGAEVTVPVTGARVPIIYHHSAKPEFGSGAVMVCSYGDHNDVALFRELELDEVAAIGPDGKMTASAGAYMGLRPAQARDKIISDLEEGGHVEKIEDIIHRTPVSERGRNPIEIIPMEEYYVKQKGAVAGLREAAKNITFHPPMHRHILENWLDSIKIDWPISRRRYYGTEIPVWYCMKCSKAHVPEPGRYHKPWKEAWPGGPCGCGSTEFRGEERTLDTWMDSSISPLYISRWGSDDIFHKMTYPASVRPQAKDIVRTWLYYTMLRCGQLTDVVPWSEAWIMGYGLDEKGLKMSKSKGNAMDPMPIIERLGADTFRFWSAGEVGHGQDFRCGEQKIESAKKFLSKLWNIARFVSGVPDVSGAAPTNTDAWVLTELDLLVGRCLKAYDMYDFFTVSVSVREFAWNVFAAHYIEMVKVRASGEGFADTERDGARQTLHVVLRTILLLLAPIIPFITDHLWKSAYSDSSIHAERLPACKDMEWTGHTGHITEFNSMVWNEKKSRGLSLKDPVSMVVPPKLEGFRRDLIAMHRLQ